MTATLDAPVAPGGASAPEHAHRSVRAAALRRYAVHLPFALLLLIATVPRAAAMAGYRPALMFFGDSQSYLIMAQSGTLNAGRPFGYGAFLRLMAWTDTLWVVPLVQHLAILGLAVVVYVVLLRLQAPVWLAVLVPAPLLLDGYQILIEHVLLTETMFTCLVIGACLLCIRRRVTIPVALVAGIMLGVAGVTRTVALLLVAILVAYLVVRRVGLRPIVAFIAGFSLVVVGYAAFFASVFGEWGVQKDGRFLYARVAPIADCRVLDLSREARALCDDAPVQGRPGSNFYAWSRFSPYNANVFPDVTTREAAGREFALATIAAQPWDYLRVVVGDVVHYFAPGRTASYQDTPPSIWIFPKDLSVKQGQSVVLSGSGFENDKATVVLDPGSRDLLRGWQELFGTQGPVLLAGLVLGLLGAAFGRGSPRGPRRPDALLFASVGTAMLVIPAATSVFDYRYALPPAAALYLAGGWGALLLLRRRRPLGVDVRSAPRPRPRRARDDVIGVAAVLGVCGAVLAAIVFSPIRDVPLYGTYIRTGGERGPLGYSLDSQREWAGVPGGVRRDFEGGITVQTPEGRRFALEQPVAAAYDAAGGPAGPGLPTASTVPLVGYPDVTVTRFERAAFVVDAEGEVFVVQPPFLSAWCRPARPCTLGPPVADAVLLADGTAIQRFENGLLVAEPGERVRRSAVP